MDPPRIPSETQVKNFVFFVVPNFIEMLTILLGLNVKVYQCKPYSVSSDDDGSADDWDWERVALGLFKDLNRSASGSVDEDSWYAVDAADRLGFQRALQLLSAHDGTASPPAQSPPPSPPPRFELSCDWISVDWKSGHKFSDIMMWIVEVHVVPALLLVLLFNVWKIEHFTPLYETTPGVKRWIQLVTQWDPNPCL